MCTIKMKSELSYFKDTGFFQEKDEAMTHLRDADEILTAEGVDYCLMFGTLLGLLRHGDFIPWDDDLDIIIFDMNRFEKRCMGGFEERGYRVLQDVRKISPFRITPFLKINTRCGYRIYSEKGKGIPGVAWKFPWIEIWEQVVKKNVMTLPPEKVIYDIDDLFPFNRTPFQEFYVMLRQNPD